MPKSKTVRISTMDVQVDFTIKPSTTGKELFDQVQKITGIRETWFFGLQHTDSEGDLVWTNPKKKVLRQGVKKENPLQFHMKVKLFPEDIDEIIQPTTLKQIYLQVKQSVLEGELPCTPEKSLLLASYALQAKHGDYNPEIHSMDFLEGKKLLPEQTYVQFSNSSKEELNRTILTAWGKEVGMLREDAMTEYLKIAQQLPSYGTAYFKIMDPTNVPLRLGVNPSGLQIYNQDDKLNSTTECQWFEIKDILFKKRQLTIKPSDKNANHVVFTTDRAKTARKIQDICTGYREMNIKRCKPDTLDVVQMKNKAREERMFKIAERDRLRSEMLARKSAEEREKMYEGMVLALQEFADQNQKDLNQSRAIVERLESQLKEVESAKKDLETRLNELMVFMKSLDDSRDYEINQKRALRERLIDLQQELSNGYLVYE